MQRKKKEQGKGGNSGPRKSFEGNSREREKKKKKNAQKVKKNRKDG